MQLGTREFSGLLNSIYANGDHRSNIIDAIVDILKLCDRQGIDFEGALRMASAHRDAESREIGASIGNPIGVVVAISFPCAGRAKEIIASIESGADNAEDRIAESSRYGTDDAVAEWREDAKALSRLAKELRKSVSKTNL
jgi:hypothetical protein